MAARQKTWLPHTLHSWRSTSYRRPPSRNIRQLLTWYPDVYGPYGFYDAVNPTTGSVGHRYLDLDQSMIMAALDNALDNRALQRHFAADPTSWAAQLYLSYEHMSIN